LSLQSTSGLGTFEVHWPPFSFLGIRNICWSYLGHVCFLGPVTVLDTEDAYWLAWITCPPCMKSWICVWAVFTRLDKGEAVLSKEDRSKGIWANKTNYQLKMSTQLLSQVLC
jgi:hypothetical protein